MTNRCTVVLLSSIILSALVVTPLLRAADEKTAAAGANLLQPTNQDETWRLEQHEGGKAAMTVDGDAVMFEVTDTGAEEWHVQAIQPGLVITDGKQYVLSFKAKATPDRTKTLNAMIDEDDWHTIGLTESAELSADWKP